MEIDMKCYCSECAKWPTYFCDHCSNVHCECECSFLQEDYEDG